MKITANQLPEVFKTLGLTVELVEDDAASDYNADTFLQTVDAARTPIIRQKLEPEMSEEAKTKFAGIYGSKLRQSLRDKTGISIAELKELTDAEAITKALEHHSRSFSQDTAGLRAEMEALIGNHEKATAELKNSHNSELTGWKKKYFDRFIEDHFEQLLNDAPYPEGADRKALNKLYKNHMESLYDIVYDENGKKVMVKDKESGRDVMNEAGTTYIDMKAGAKDFFTPLGVWQPDMRSAGPNAAQHTNKGEDYRKPEGGAAVPITDPMKKALAFAGEPAK